MSDKTRSNLEWLLGLKTVRADKEYYAFRLGADHRDVPFWERTTHFLKWSARNPRWEVREASLVDATWMTWLWSKRSSSGLIVSDKLALAVFFGRGGNALVEKSLAESLLPSLVAPFECMHDGTVEAGGCGFLPTQHLSDDSFDRRSPSRTLRITVLRRDDYRCVVCGRRARDHIDIELHVHHVVPWRMAGPTAEENLVTLCGTCHKGLVPDYDPVLRELAGLPGPPSRRSERTEKSDEEVLRYQRWMARQNS